MPPSNKRVPAIRFSGFVEEWKEVTFASVVEIQASKEFIANPVEGGKYPVIQQGEEPIAGYSDKQPYKEFGGSILFGDHTLSLFKPNTPFLIATDGVKIFQAKEIDSNYLFHELLTKRPTSQGYKRHLNILKGVALIISRNSTEQSRIGQFFRTLDKLVELRKKKLDKLITLKKELLNKLFPQQGQKIPAIRFSGFVEEWKEVALGELAGLITKGTTPLEKRGKGEINFIKVESIDPLSGKICVKTRISRKEHDGFLKRSKLKENDILFSIAGTLGRVCCVPSEILPANTNQALAIIRVEKADVKFLTVALNGRMTAEYIRCNPTIGAQPNLSLKQVGELPICHPNIGEQARIGQFFQTFDNLIELRKKELDGLNNMKFNFLNRMFV